LAMFPGEENKRGPISQIETGSTYKICIQTQTTMKDLIQATCMYEISI